AVHAAGESGRVWVNSADDPANCSFTLMSVISRGDLVVSVGTGGRSPALAAHLRRRLQEEIGPEYETLLDLLADAREELRGARRPRRALGGGSRRVRRPSLHLLRRSRGRAPVLGRGRPRLDDRR